MHLPFYAAVADGLFAEHGLDVELLESASGSERVKLLAAGKGDFLLTATLYHFQALVEEGPLPVRACAVLHRRSPVAGLVRADSLLATPDDLAGRRLGAPLGTQMGWLGVEFQAAMAERGLEPAEVANMTYREAYPALARGEIDLIANFADLVAIDQQRAGVALRAVPVGPDVYTSALLAHDDVPDDVVQRMTAAVTQSYARQRQAPARGVAELRAMYPDVDPDVAVDTWRGLEAYAFGGGALTDMDEAAWERAVSWAVRVHGLPHEALDTSRFLRPPMPVRTG